MIKLFSVYHWHLTWTLFPCKAAEAQGVCMINSEKSPKLSLLPHLSGLTIVATSRGCQCKSGVTGVMEYSPFPYCWVRAPHSSVLDPISNSPYHYLTQDLLYIRSSTICGWGPWDHQCHNPGCFPVSPCTHYQAKCLFDPRLTVRHRMHCVLAFASHGRGITLCKLNKYEGKTTEDVNFFLYNAPELTDIFTATYYQILWITLFWSLIWFCFVITVRILQQNIIAKSSKCLF